jgi:ENTS family enterobactin (siderophore) exporter
MRSPSNSRRRLIADLTPLRVSPQYRLLLGTQLAGMLGANFTAVAVPYQVWVLTHSSLLVGLAGLVEAVPLTGGMLAGGALADAHDRRRLLLTSRLLLAFVGAGLALNVGAGRGGLGRIFALIAVYQLLTGLGSPAATAAIPGLIPAELLPANGALSAIIHQGSTVAGPAFAGLLIAKAGVASAYWVDVAGFAIQVALLVAMRPLRPGAGGRRASVGAIGEGLRYVGKNPLVLSLLLIDLDAMVFGMPRALFPALGTGLFHGDATTVGLLFAAPGAGAVVAAVASGWVGRVRRAGIAVVAAVVAWGAAITVFGLVPWLPLALALLALAGAADVVSEVFRTTLLQLAAPDNLRGRISALWLAQVTASPRVGDAEAGAVAAISTPQISVISGGLACMAGAVVLALLIPGLRHARAATPGPRGEPARPNAEDVQEAAGASASKISSALSSEAAGSASGEPNSGS